MVHEISTNSTVRSTVVTHSQGTRATFFPDASMPRSMSSIQPESGDRLWYPLVDLLLVSFWGFAICLAILSSASAERGQHLPMNDKLLLPGEQIIIGTVQHVKGDVIQVNIGQLEPLFLSLRDATEKGMTRIQAGDKLKIVVSGQNQVVDVHQADAPGWDRVLKGHLLQPLMGDHRWAVIQTQRGANETYQVDKDARHTVMNLPVGVPALFLLNKENILVDATFGEEGALLDTLAQWSKDRQRVVHE